MDLGKAGWLLQLLAQEEAKHRPGEALKSLAPQLQVLSGRARARRYLQRSLRTSGLLYGTPAKVLAEDPGRAPEDVLFLAVVGTFARIALDMAELTGAAPASRSNQLLLLFAALCGDLDLVDELQREMARSATRAVPKRLSSKVESELERRAMSLTGDPAYGLVLHNGAVYSDAQLFGRQAIDYFRRGTLTEDGVLRRMEVAGKQKAMLVEVLAALACAERPPSYSSRRAILRQIEDLHLPPRIDGELRSKVKTAFEKQPSLKTIVRDVKSRDMRRFILEQTILASLVDGRRSPRELEFIQELVVTLRFSQSDRWGVEVEMAEFYAKNRSVVDVFTVAAGAGVMGEELVESMQRTLEKNFQRLMQEVRETGELSVLLAKAARGQSLTKDERKKMRAQLIDVAKAIPALAIFAAPGGVLLLIALAKVMPFNILPSAFQDEPPENKPERK